MDLGLSGKIALVTGSSKGIGLSIAQALAAEGATVYVNGRLKRLWIKRYLQLNPEKPEA